MTTARQVKKLVEPLLARHSELALVGRLIVLKPVHHIVRGVLIGRTGSAKQCQPRWLATYLFAKLDYVPVGDGELLHRPDGHWEWSDPGLPNDLIEVVERDALPRLHALATLQDFLNFTLPNDLGELRFYRAMQSLFLIAMGDLDEARDIINTEKQAGDFWTPRLDRLGLKEKLFELGDRLGPEDRAKLANLLHDWEAYTVEKLKLNPVWERTPFPLEALPPTR